MKDDWTPIERWGHYLNNLEGEAMEMIAVKEPMIRKALTVEDVFVQNEEERRLYELREKGRLRFENAIFTAELRGKKEGIKEGIRTAARSMLARNMPLQQISEITGLSAEEIKALDSPNA
jgi:predicted transposase/invertase (TIGR01784 family)